MRAEDKLSPKERRVLELLGQGLQVEQIAREMVVSPYFVRVLLENTRVKLLMTLSENLQGLR